MPRTAHPMTSISSALRDLRAALEGLVSEHQHFRQQLEGMAQRASIATGATSSAAAAPAGGPVGQRRDARRRPQDAQGSLKLQRRTGGGLQEAGRGREERPRPGQGAEDFPPHHVQHAEAGGLERPTRPARRTHRSRHPRTRSGRTEEARSGSSSSPTRRRRDSGSVWRMASARGVAKRTEGPRQGAQVSLPTMYNTLKRAGWKGRNG